jgi:hypothetical protein
VAYFKVLSHHSSVETEKTRKMSAGSHTEIRIGYLPKTNVDGYQPTNLLCVVRLTGALSPMVQWPQRDANHVHRTYL